MPELDPGIQGLSMPLRVALDRRVKPGDDRQERLQRGGFA